MFVISRIGASFRVLWAFSWGFLWVLVLHSIWRASPPKSGAPWVIGGYRGRHYGDNPAAVEGEARRQGKAIVWIANPEAADAIRARGVTVLLRGSWAARRAISQAPALLYSHGEDDLDLLLNLLRGRTSLRIYLGHCLSLLKAGGVADPVLRGSFAPFRALRIWLLTRWDIALCASEEELDNLKRTYPMNHGFVLGGGAHLDEWKQGTREETQKRIYYFPTFRDTANDAAGLTRIIKEIVDSKRLRQWLLENGYEFLIGTHINGRVPALPLEPPFRPASLSHLVADIRVCELLISDYSGVLFDFLLLERPQILFAFDLPTYLKSRDLYLDYTTLDFGLHPRTSNELVEMITSGAWRSKELTAAAHARRKLSLPKDAESFAVESVLAIERELVRFGSGRVAPAIGRA